MLDKLYQQSMRERLYLRGVSPKTMGHYEQCWTAFRKACKGDDIGKALVLEFVSYWKDKRIKHCSINTYARALNTFFNWMSQEGYSPERIKIPKFREEEREIKAFEPAELNFM